MLARDEDAEVGRRFEDWFTSRASFCVGLDVLSPGTLGAGARSAFSAAGVLLLRVFETRGCDG